MIVVDQLERRRRQDEEHGRACSGGSASTGKTLVIDVKPDDEFTLTARNIAGVKLVAAARVTARDVIDTAHIVATREAIEKLQETLGSSSASASFQQKAGYWSW